MITKDNMLKIIEAGNLAPSGSNSQPWSFDVKNSTLYVRMHPEKDHPVLNFKNRGTLLAHGALVENILITSKYLGYESNIHLLPEEGTSVIFEFKESSPQKEYRELYEAIPERCSNRKPFLKEPLDEITKKYLLEEVANYPDIEVKIIEGKDISQVAPFLPTDSLVFFSNKKLHELLFREILWKEEEQKEKPGLYFKTLEIDGPKKFIFKLLSDWKKATFFNKIGLIKKIYQESWKIAQSCSLLGFISVDDNEESFIKAGRLLENIWLRATSKGLYLQLIAGMFYLWQQANFGNKDIFSNDEIKLINEAYKNISNILSPTKELAILAFRIGKGKPPLARSLKRAPIIKWH